LGILGLLMIIGIKRNKRTRWDLLGTLEHSRIFPNFVAEYKALWQAEGRLASGL
jgi:hypothetical protein